MATISTLEFEHALEAWPAVAPILFVPRDEVEYDKLVDVLNHLLDQGGSDEQHPLADLVNIVGTLIAEYERQHHGEFSEP
jgi:HTH-type transcriptional regulator/antitoxin HigA